MLLRSAFFLALIGCGDPGQLGRSTVLPSDVMAHVALEDVPVLGAEVSVVRRDDTKVTGELLEASEERVTLLREATIVRIAADDIRQVIVTRYENRPLIAVLAVWSGAGAITGATHGVFAAVTEPLWGGISAGAIMPVAEDEGRFAYTERRSDLAILHEYARFPQGIPPLFGRR